MSQRTVKTVKELRELLNPERYIVMLDSGGFVWHSAYDAGGSFFIGVACLAQSMTRGQTQQAWVNAFYPGKQLKAYGPFTVIYDSKDQQ